MECWSAGVRSLDLASFPTNIFSAFDGGPCEKAEEEDEGDGKKDDEEWVELPSFAAEPFELKNAGEVEGDPNDMMPIDAQADEGQHESCHPAYQRDHGDDGSFLCAGSESFRPTFDQIFEAVGIHAERKDVATGEAVGGDVFGLEVLGEVGVFEDQRFHGFMPACRLIVIAIDEKHLTK